MTEHEKAHTHHETHKEHEDKPKRRSRRKEVEAAFTTETWNRIIVLVGAILIIGILAGVGVLMDRMQANQYPLVGPYCPINTAETGDGIVSPDKAEEQLGKFISLASGATPEFTEVKSEMGLYIVTGALPSSEGEQSFEVYMTRNGEIAFMQMVNLTEAIDFFESSGAASTFAPPKQEKPLVQFFVMSFCPYGKQAEQGLSPVQDALGDKVMWEPHYVIYSHYADESEDYCIENGEYCSMHGIRELREDIRQLCVLKHYGTEKFWDYVDAVNAQCTISNIETCWKEAAKKAGVSEDSVTQCLDTEGTALIKAEYEKNQEFGVSGSPAVFINGEQYSGGRAPNDYKNAICPAFTAQPSECSQELSTSSSGSAGEC
ncbi:MAG: thioredoxin domain-containing protein [Candidatus Diapherotrites archaeon]|nr:thioredoxin domain-containing protein [Candidatus Diapherotrites archaeon]